MFEFEQHFLWQCHALFKWPWIISPTLCTMSSLFLNVWINFWCFPLFAQSRWVLWSQKNSPKKQNTAFSSFMLMCKTTDWGNLVYLWVWWYNKTHNGIILPFRLTIWWDLWWRQPRWHSRYRVFWCLLLCPCGSSTGRPDILPELAGSERDPLQPHMLLISETEAGEWREKGCKKTEIPSVENWKISLPRTFQQIISTNILTESHSGYVRSQGVRQPDPTTRTFDSLSENNPPVSNNTQV